MKGKMGFRSSGHGICSHSCHLRNKESCCACGQNWWNEHFQELANDGNVIEGEMICLGDDNNTWTD